uniref:Uncharacterized protein n=1 Tax=Panagrolaimus davidi TaxID=227884 RepID=A0A914QT14_9BILA
MLVFNIFSFLFLLVFIAKINAGISIFIDLQCVELRYTILSSTIYETPKSAMRACAEIGSTCIGIKKTSENGYQQLRGLTGYVYNETCKDYYLWDGSGGQTFPNQPTPLEPKILFAIYKLGECPVPFDVDGTLCRGRSSITKDVCYTYPSYMVPQWDGTSCSVVQRQTVLNLWA